MQKKILAACAAAVCLVALVGLAASPSSETKSEAHDEAAQDYPLEGKNIVLIAVSSSRPGCEQTNLCYVQPNITVSSGETVTWINEDRAFHTVTAGYYDTPEDDFDSEYLNPEETFSHKFDEAGMFHYYCRLHPWMEGTVTVQ